MTDLQQIEAKLDRLENLIQRQPPVVMWMDLRTASKRCGLSPSTLNRAIQAGRLKASKVTGKILIKPIWLDKYLMFGKQRLTPGERKELEGIQ